MKGKRGLKWIRAVVEALIIFMVLKFVLRSQIPLATVASGSMLPLLERGDLVFVQGVNPKEIKVGDIIVYRTCTGAFIVHRVIEIIHKGSNIYLVTKGDNNPYTDKMLGQFVDCKTGMPTPGVPARRVIGKVFEIGGMPFKIPYLGYVSIIAFPFLWWLPR